MTVGFGAAPNYPDNCKLIEGYFAYAVQIGLALVALASLAIKRFMEKPRRKWKIWFMDVSKQACSAGTAHFVNMAIAMFISWIIGNGGQSEHQCSWYFITFTMDTTLGMAWAYGGLKFAEWVGRRWKIVWLKSSGDYGDPPNYKHWILQLISWNVIVLVGRMLNGGLEMALITPLNYVAAWMGFPFRYRPKFYLLLIMIACPIGMDLIQFWVQDQFLKLAARRKQRRQGSDVESAPLLSVENNGADDDACDDDVPGVLHRSQSYGSIAADASGSEGAAADHLLLGGDAALFADTDDADGAASGSL